MHRFAGTLCAWLLLAAPAFAIQQRNLEIVTPRGGTRGTTVEVLLQGMDLANPREIIFYRGGIVAVQFEPLPPLQYPIGLMHGSKVIEQLKVRFKIAADCPLGEHPFRLRTAHTLSTLATFWVGPLPTLAEKEKGIGDNDVPAKAEAVPLNSTVQGNIHPGNTFDRDLYRVEVAQGERLSVEVDALRLSCQAYGDSEYDLLVRILDGEGHELAHNDDSALHIQDPLLSVIVPKQGTYFVEVRQSSFKPHSYGYYRVHIGSFMRPLAAYPAGGQASETIAIRLLGDAAGDISQNVTLPKQPGKFDFFAGPAIAPAPSPLALRVSPYPNVLETEPNNDPAARTNAVSVPVALNGIIERNGDIDYFRVKFSKGKAYRVRVFARSLGTPLDPKIWIQRVGAAAGETELEADDSRLADRDIFALSGNARLPDLLDPSVIFTPKEEGEYLLGIGDTRDLGSPQHIYRVEIEPAHDSAYTYVASTANDAFEVNRATGFIVPRGNRWTINVLVGEGQGKTYSGDLELEAVGLPAGVSMIAPRVAKGMKAVPVQFVAGPEVQEQTSLIEILARPVDRKVPFASGSQQGVPFINHSGGHAWHFVMLDRFPLAVTQPAPFHIELEQPRIALAQSGELTLKVKVVRDAGFDEAVDLLPEWLPPGVAGENAVTVAPGQTEAKFSLHADTRAQPGSHKIAMNATTTGGLFYSGVGRIRVSSSFIDLAVGEPYLSVNLRRAAVKRGQQGQIVCDVKQLKSFPGKATAVLRRLPKGIEVIEPMPQISATDKQVVFQISAASDSLVGQYKGIVCEVTVEENGQSIRQEAGTGVLRVDPAPGVVATP